MLAEVVLKSDEPARRSLALWVVSTKWWLHGNSMHTTPRYKLMWLTPSSALLKFMLNSDPVFLEIVGIGLSKPVAQGGRAVERVPEPRMGMKG